MQPRCLARCKEGRGRLYTLIGRGVPKTDASAPASSTVEPSVQVDGSWGRNPIWMLSPKRWSCWPNFFSKTLARKKLR